MKNTPQTLLLVAVLDLGSMFFKGIVKTACRLMDPPPSPLPPLPIISVTSNISPAPD